MVEKILKVLTVDGKDIRKAEWSNKEVSDVFGFCHQIFLFMMKKSTHARLTQLVEEGVTPQYPKRYHCLSDRDFFLFTFLHMTHPLDY